MRLTKAERAELKKRFGGRCAYCGSELLERWHADHLEAIERKHKFVQGENRRWKKVQTGEMYAPENDHIANMMPSCAPCNIDKHSLSIEDWRVKLQGGVDVLNRNSPTYRHTKRFGLLTETNARVVFYFEGDQWPKIVN